MTARPWCLPIRAKILLGVVALAATPPLVAAQEACRPARAGKAVAARPELAALASINFGMQGHVRAVLVDTVVRLAPKLGLFEPSRLPASATLSRLDVEHLSLDSLPFRYASYDSAWTPSDTARVALMRIASSGLGTPTGSSKARPDSSTHAEVLVLVFGRPFAANFFVHVALRRQRANWVVLSQHCFEE